MFWVVTKDKACLQNAKCFVFYKMFTVRNCPGYIWKWAFLKEGDVEDPFKEGNYTDEQKLTLIEKELYRFILIHFPDSFPNMSSPDPPTLYDWGFEVIECRKVSVNLQYIHILSIYIKEVGDTVIVGNTPK